MCYVVLSQLEWNVAINEQLLIFLLFSKHGVLSKYAQKISKEAVFLYSLIFQMLSEPCPGMKDGGIGVYKESCENFFFLIKNVTALKRDYNGNRKKISRLRLLCSLLK